MLIIFRLLQGIGAAGGTVIARSVAADLYSGRPLLSLMAAVQGIAPIVAPVVGGVLLLITDWKGIFIFLGMLSLCVLVSSVYLRESYPTVSSISNCENICHEK
jgi:DHA1 family bicyclomycin/chloramphenicol resistance-like MFS transporter